MNKKIDGLLHKLREAIHEALAESWDVAHAMAELEQEGCLSHFFRGCRAGGWRRTASRWPEDPIEYALMGRPC
jgi:hypothetical protein